MIQVQSLELKNDIALRWIGLCKRFIEYYYFKEVITYYNYSLVFYVKVFRIYLSSSSQQIVGGIANIASWKRSFAAQQSDTVRFDFSSKYFAVCNAVYY